MHPSEATAALAADDRLGILLDRRRLDGGRAVPGDLLVVATVDVPTRSREVRAALVTAADGGALPRRGGEAAHGQVRLMDRFYLPAVRDDAVIAPMFDMIAGIYDSLTDRRLNLASASRLLLAALADAGPNPRILDFGCGTGIAFDALAALATPARLLGVDLSDAMLARAAGRGLAALPIAAWRLDPPPVDGAIANFVLHYGVPAADLSRIAGSLRPNAVFAANLFGAERKLLDDVAGALGRGGLVLEEAAPLAGVGRPDLLLRFRKPR